MQAKSGLWNTYDEFFARVQTRRQEAEAAGDEPEAVKLRAMENVMETKLVPLSCPDAVVVAGNAARAAYEGRNETEWYTDAVAERRDWCEGAGQLDMAIRVLRLAGLWPWQ